MTIETGVPVGDGEGVGVGAGMDEYDDPPQPNDKLNRSVPSAIRNFLLMSVRDTKDGPWLDNLLAATRTARARQRFPRRLRKVPDCFDVCKRSTATSTGGADPPSRPLLPSSTVRTPVRPHRDGTLGRYWAMTGGTKAESAAAPPII